MFSQDEEEEPMQGKEELLQGKAEEEELQMKSDSVGSAGTKTSMPEGVKSQMESSFNTDFSGVNIHQNSDKATNIGALAYTQGSDVHFASGQYNPGSQKGQTLLGHELAHVVQQREGRVQPTTQVGGAPVNDNSSLEKEADVMGARAVQGKRNSIAQNLGNTSESNSVRQCYTLKDVASQSAREWNVGADIRVADDGMTVTKERNSKLCYAYPSLIVQSNQELRAKNSGVELVAGSRSIEGTAPNGSGKKSLKEVIPKMSFSKSGADSSQTSWEDCGRMSHEVMGRSGTDQYPHGVYTDNGGNLQETARTGVPYRHRDNILVALGLGTTPAIALAAYNAMSAANKEAFDKKHGLNRYASPSVGEAFATNNAKNFNFHWGGVVLKTGGDSVTLENFAKGNPYDAQDSNWYFKTYGPASKPGQTFDDQWNSTVGTDTFTTRTATRSIVGEINTNGIPLYDNPIRLIARAGFVLGIGTKIKKLDSFDSLLKVRILSGLHNGIIGYISAHHFTGL